MTYLPIFTSSGKRRKGLFPERWPWGDLSELLELTNQWPSATESRINVMPLDVEETDNEYHVKVSAAGVEKSNIEVTLENKMLTVAFKESGEKERKEKNYLYKERYEGAASRSIELPLANMQGEAVAQLTSNGVLEIVVKKGETNKTTRIAVK